MKRYVLAGSVLLMSLYAVSQSTRVRPKPNGLINTKLLANAKFDNGPVNEQLHEEDITVSSAPPVLKPSVITNSWNNFTSSMNIYGVIISYCKPLQWNDELNAISFIHRKSPSYAPNPSPSTNAESGSMVAMISIDCGVTWDSTCIYANDTYWGRYPGGAIYNPSTNNDINNAYIVGAGPTTGNTSATWIGNWYASKPLGQVNYDNTPSMIQDAQQVMPTLGPYTPNLGRHDFSAYGFTATDDGKMRVLAGVTDDGTASDTALVLVTGTFNSSTSTFDWAGTVFNPPTTTASDGTENWISRPIMAWNEMGTVGYIVVMGVRMGSTGSNEGLQPIVYKTVNSGTTWTLENGINFNSSAYDDVKRSLVQISTSATEVPWFNWIEGMDCAVDANNKLHIFTSIAGAISNHPDSAFWLTSFGTEGYRWPHVPGFRPYLYDFIYDGTAMTPAWSHITIDSMSTEGMGENATDNGYQDNPWDTDPSQSNAKVRVDARLQMSRTPDGQYLVYTWGESDTTLTNSQKKWNSVPNVKARAMKVSTGMIYPSGLGPAGNEIDITGSGPVTIAQHAMYHFVSPKCRLASTNTVNGPVLSLPVTVSNSNPYHQLTANTHWFSWATLNFGNVPDNQILLCGPITPTITVGVADNVYSSASSSYIFPNPTKNNATVSINLLHDSKIQVDIMNTVGQIVRSSKHEGQNGMNNIQIDLDGLVSGIYMVNVKVDNASSTKKLVVE
jgi:hypothetical protein